MTENGDSPARISRPAKTVVFSAMTEGGKIEYAVAPMKTSYSEAIAIAFEVLGDHLVDLAPDTACLKMGVRDASGSLVWAFVAPSLWNEIVSEGAELRIFPTSTSAAQMRIADASGRKQTRPLITLKIPELFSNDGNSMEIRTIAPTSYDATKIFAFEAAKNRFKNCKKSWKDVILLGIADDGPWRKVISFESHISACGTGENVEWMNFIVGQLKENPNFKILMY